MITSIRLHEAFCRDNGLLGTKEPIRGMGKLVVLAGPNGAGKSRYLQLLQHLCALAYDVERTSNQWRANLTNWETKLDQLNQATRPPANVNERANLERAINSTREALLAIKEVNLQSSTTEAPNFINLTYIVNRGSIKLSHQMTQEEANVLAKKTTEPGFSPAFMGMHAYFTTIAIALAHRYNERFKDKTQAMLAAKDADRFNDLLDQLVGGRIDVDVDEQNSVFATFRGRRFDPRQLSNGEAILTAWTIVLHQQGPQLANTILIIDEPENHLHPDACIKALCALRDILGPHGQIWVATHAIQIISFAGLDSVWLVEDGRLTYGGNKVNTVLDRLLGGPEGRRRFRSFLDDAENLAFCKFAAECLTAPAVVTHKEKDPQEAQFVQVVERRKADGKSLRILDYGAGRGRLAKALYEARCAAKEVPFELAYYAYNGPAASSAEKEECRRHLMELQQAPNVQRAEHIEDLREFAGAEAEKMDLVILCNVLHEIPVAEWMRDFSKIDRIISREGTVLIMEDQYMSIGELPSSHGFIVLDEIEVAALFGTQRGTKVRTVSSMHSGRLSTIEIQAEALAKISKHNIDVALDFVMERSESQIKRLRDASEKTFQTGRQHAYYAMLYMNAKLAK